jgi:small-conductance mechanosensitive channel
VFLVAVSIYVGLSLPSLPARNSRWLEAAVSVAVFWQVGLWLSAGCMAWLDRKRRRCLENDPGRIGPLGIIALVARALVWILVVLLLLDNLGVDVTALVAGLGIGGVAVALALQNILGDLFASLAITLDKPFVTGDFLAVGESLGTVEQIGIKTTRLRSLSGEQIVIANADLLGSRVRNYGRMVERRVDLRLSLVYETALELLEAVPGMVRDVVDAQQGTRFGRCHLAGFGDHSLDFECVYFVLSADYDKHMDLLQSIHFGILRAFQRRGVEFAYPTRKLLVHPAPEGSPARCPAWAEASG